MENERESNDLSLAPNEFAFVQDTTNGRIQTYAGPFATSLTKTDRAVIFDHRSKSFVQVPMDKARQLKAVAPEGWYIQLKNPAKDAAQSHPPEGGKHTMPELMIGRKENVAGAVSFALWPGQMVRVIQGHHLREDEYVLIRIYDEKSARENWQFQQVKTRDGSSEDESAVAQANVPKDLMTGKLYVVKGTDVSFYVPTTGIEVVPFTEEGDDARQYIRKAVTLERLEYCILLDQDGNKRYVEGPAVVFPEPTEDFVEVDGETKFRAFELNPNSGLYIKVIADYEENGKKYNVGDELFITGKTHPIYFPREEHSLIKYGDHHIHYGIMIPAGEARYVADRDTGIIRLEKGPKVFLPDPRHEVVLRRILEPKLCNLMYPGNVEALSYNQALISRTQHLAEDLAMLGDTPVAVAGAAGGMLEGGLLGGGALYSANMAFAATADSQTAMPGAAMARGISPKRAKKSVAGDEISRGHKYTPPRTLTLNAKYDGAVTINVFEGYAVMLTRKGEKTERRIIMGPQTAMLEYDEIPHVLRLSTGKPKTTTQMLDTVYLKVSNNPVTDFIQAESRDYCKVTIKLSYRVSFDGNDPEKWFSIENYVKFLCDHMRSMIRNEIKRHDIVEFYQNSTDVLRDLILGKRPDGGERPGRRFEENAMTIRDVEVLAVELDNQLAGLLVGAQTDVIKQNLALAKAERELEFTTQSEEFARSIAQARFATLTQKLSLDREEQSQRARGEEERRNAQLAIEKLDLSLTEAEANKERARHQPALDLTKAKNELEAARISVETLALKERAGAISDKFIAALESVSEDLLIERVTQALGPMRILEVAGGKSIKDILAGLFEGSPLGDRIKKLSGNGSDYNRTVPPAE